MHYQKQEAGKSKIAVLCVVVPLLFIALLAYHEISIRYFQDVTCGVCHEMEAPVTKWQESGTAKNHNNCAGCHFEASMEGRWEMHKAAVKELVAHFKRDPNEPIKPPAEPLFLEAEKEPAYWSYVPNSRCFQCKDAKNHGESDQQQIHAKVIQDILNQPCKDCHSHEMREGQKFYQKILPEKKKVALGDSADRAAQLKQIAPASNQD